MNSVLFLYLTGEGADCVQGAGILHRVGNSAARIDILLPAGKFTHCASSLGSFFLAVKRMSFVAG